MRLNEQHWKWAIAAFIFVVVLVIYRLTSAPTASFWDCSELIACSYILGIPHPPGTPLFVLLGRIFALLPIAREPAARIGFLTSFFGAVTCVLVYLVVVKLIKSSRNLGSSILFRSGAVPSGAETQKLDILPYLGGLIGALSLGFAYSFWGNSIETEVYGPVTSVGLLVLLLALHWRDEVRAGTSDNRTLLATIFLVFLSAGIHFTPMLTVFALVAFWLMVDRRAVIHLRLLEFAAGFLILLTVQTMIEGGTSPLVWVIVGLILLAMLGLGVWLIERSAGSQGIIWGLLVLFGMFVVAYFAGFDARTGRDMIVDDLVLFLASPSSALIERWRAGPALTVLFAAGYAGYLYWLRRRRRLDLQYVLLGLILVMLAGTIQYVMMVRARNNPGINEVDPKNWSSLVSVLKREQYDPMKLYPRKTMFASEADYINNQNPQLGLLAGYFEQIKFYLRYFFWQWAGPQNLDILAHSRNWYWPFLRLNPIPGLIGLVVPLLGLLGIVSWWRQDRKGCLLIGLAFLVASLGLLTYLNLKLSPSDPRHLDPDLAPGMHFVEVRERDYFFAFSFIFFAVFVGLGAYSLFRRSPTRWRRPLIAGAILVSFMPVVFNFRQLSRAGDWIPAEYGYNMLASCEDGSVLFTNGDNDTFPLWFVQQVPTRITGYQDGFLKPVPPARGVFVANLSLLNTDWYIRQMIAWGAPFSFDAARFESLPHERYFGAGDRGFLLRDLAIRDMIATNTGVQLRWGNEYLRYYDPRTGRMIAVPAYRDEYQTARQRYAVEMKMLGVVGDDPGRGEVAQEFLAASRRYHDWLERNRYSIAAIELSERLPRYQELARQRAAADTILKEKSSFERWLNRGDYGMPSEEFVRYVLTRYRERIPLFFSTTVQEDLMRDLIVRRSKSRMVTEEDSVYVQLEGLVQRVVARPGPLPPRQRAFNAERTRELIENVYQIKSMSDKSVTKDQNSRGMFTNFLLAALRLADDHYARNGELEKAKATALWAMQLDMEPPRRLPLYEALGRYAYLSGNFDEALNYLDTLSSLVDDQGSRQHLLLLRSFVYQLKGDYARATGLISGLTAAGLPPRMIATVFDTLYATYFRYRQDGHPWQVLKLWRQYDPRDSIPIWLEQDLEPFRSRQSLK